MTESASPFWLSHHGATALNRCFLFGRWYVCARCLGTYPSVLLSLLLQFWRADFTTSASDSWWVVALALPATVDWAWGQFRPHSGFNLFRWLTGLLLGLAIGRALFLHLLVPFGPPMQRLMAFTLAVAVPVLALRLKKGAQ